MSAAREQRADLQGLRALAVGLVLLYHLWPNRLGGGFVGVDVFFVISGFLIGGHLLAELEQTGTVRLGRFWSRRARRLLPASLLVLAAVALAVVVLVPGSQRADFLHQVAGSALYVQNWVLADQAVDYLALGDAAAPVQHYWSLSVEEQLYVALPAVLVVTTLVARGPGRRGGRGARRCVVALVALLALGSLAWSAVSTGTDPGVAYFSTLTRAWEFLAGALLAAARLRLGPRARSAAGSAGAVAIAASAVLIDGSTPFPGTAAVAPVLGAVLVVAAHGRGPVAWAAGWRPVTWLGDVSYAVYLWHWPLIVLVPYATGVPLDATAKLAILGATLVLAGASTYVVERPSRPGAGPRSDSRGRVVLVATGVVTLLVASGAVVGARVADQEQRDQLRAARAQLAGGDVGCLGAAALDPATTGCPELGDVLLPPASSASIDDGNRTECWAGFGVSDLRLCGFGSQAPGAPRVLAVGDSHNNVYLPAYETLADELGWRVDVAGRAGCSWSERPQDGRSETIAGECKAWKQALLDHLDDTPAYDLILTTADQAGYLAEPSGDETAREATVAGLREAWSRQVARGTTVVALRDYPIGVADVVQCVEREQSDASGRCARPRERAFPRFDALATAVDQTPGTALLDLRDLMCTARSCPAVLGNVVVYRNRDHLTASFVRTLTPYLADRLPQAERRARASLRADAP